VISGQKFVNSVAGGKQRVDNARHE